MSLSESTAHTRPWAGRDPEFEDAMRRAEERAIPKPAEPHFLGRTRAGLVKRRDGSFIAPGPHFDRSEFEALPIFD